MTPTPKEADEKIKSLLSQGSVMWNNKPNEPRYGLNYHKGDWTMYLQDLGIFRQIQTLKQNVTN